jgi:HEAT repeat protein
MVVRDYKIRSFLSIAFGFIIAAAMTETIGAGAREDAIARGALKRVEAISRSEASLERFGKSTLSESAILLDLGSEAQPELLRSLRKKQGDWKLRYWVIDMLAYVGDPSAEKILVKISKSRKENPQVRKRAAESLREIKRRFPSAVSTSP